MFLRKRSVSSLFMFAVLFFILTGCGTQEENTGNTNENTQNEANEENEQSAYPGDVEQHPVVAITMESGQEIVLELYPEAAPNTVASFISLIEDGFYDGLIFHRVIPEFMVQGGDPEGRGTGGPGYAIKGEFAANGFEENNIKHERGVISMARSKHPDSAGSQFFIMVKEATHLDGEYAAFGKVVEGMETVDAIVAAPRDGSDKPLEDQKMKTVTVDTQGYDYSEPNVQ